MATILIVDDHSTTRFLLKSVLNNQGHETLEAPNGQVALELISAHPDIALLITDIKMPVMSGLELLEALAYRHTLPKLIVTGETISPPLAELGVQGFFSKPLDLPKFKQTVERLIN